MKKTTDHLIAEVLTKPAIHRRAATPASSMTSPWETMTWIALLQTAVMTPSGTYGVLSTSSKKYRISYSTNIGWDFATGIGTLNVEKPVKEWDRW